MNHIILAGAVLLSISLVGCDQKEKSNPSAGNSLTTMPAPATTRSAAAQQAIHDKLMGTWIAHDVDVSLGEVKIKLTFHQNGPVKLVAWSDIPFVGKVRSKKAPYRIEGNSIVSDALSGGTSARFWFKDGHLYLRLKDGKTLRFERE